MTAWLREPLLHFSALGAVLFVLFAWIGTSGEQPEEIVVSEATIEGLAHGFQGVWDRAPTKAELDDLIAEYTREEIYYRAAVAAGLDRDDSIVRRRLRQKMEFLAAEPLARTEPTDAELASFIAARSARYRGADGAAPDDEELRRRAARDWLAEAKERATDAYYEKLRRQYTVRVEDAPNLVLQTDPHGR
jgi:hypothetical protein